MVSSGIPCVLLLIMTSESAWAAAENVSRCSYFILLINGQPVCSTMDVFIVLSGGSNLRDFFFSVMSLLGLPKK